MQACFSIDVDPSTSTMRITMAGFFEADDIRRFVARRDAEHMRLRCPPNAHVTLVDIRGMKIQSQASVEQFARILNDPIRSSHRIAFVVETSLAHAQIRRAAAGRDASFHLSIDAAEAWLRQPPGPAALTGAGRDAATDAA